MKYHILYSKSSWIHWGPKTCGNGTGPYGDPTNVDIIVTGFGFCF